MKVYFENLYTNKLENLEEMNKCLHAFDLPKLNHEDINHLNRSITSNEIEAVIFLTASNNVFQQRKPKTFKEPTPMLLNLFHERESKRTLPNPFYKASITLIPKQDKDTTKKKRIIEQLLMNIDTKIFNEIFANQNEQHIEKIIHHDQVAFIPGYKDRSTYVKQHM
jgi:hypothetical protein